MGFCVKSLWNLNSTSSKYDYGFILILCQRSKIQYKCVTRSAAAYQIKEGKLL